MIGRVLALGTLTGLLFLLAAALIPGTASADPGPGDWSRLRTCESGGDYTIVSSNGRYYGAYQFTVGTWHSVGGTGRPDQATPTEQDYRALYLYRMRGWQPWTCAITLGLKPDADAASGRVPTYAESARMAGRPTTAPPAPPWPGRVYRYGDCAPELRTWQLRMNAYGYRFDGTGCYYDKTRTAVLALQRANNINDTGLLGPKTWAAAWTGTPPPHP